MAVPRRGELTEPGSRRLLAALALLHPHGGRARRRRTRSYFLASRMSASSIDGGDHSIRADWAALAATTTTSGSIRRTPDRMIVGNDGGVIDLDQPRPDVASRPRSRSRRCITSPSTIEIPYNVYGNRQDGPSYRGPSNSRLASGAIPARPGARSAAARAAGPRPTPSTRTSSGPATRLRSGAASIGSTATDRDSATTSRSGRTQPSAGAAADLKYRFNWTFPIAISPHDHNTVYVGQPARARHDGRRPDAGRRSART